MASSLFGISVNYAYISSNETFCLGKYILRLSKIEHELWHELYSCPSSAFLNHFAVERWHAPRWEQLMHCVYISTGWRISTSSIFCLSPSIFLGGYFLRIWMTNLWPFLIYGVFYVTVAKPLTHDLQGRQILLKSSFAFIYLILKQDASYILQEIQTGHWHTESANANFFQQRMLMLN